MEEIFLRIHQYPLPFFVCAILSLIPMIAWFLVFRQKNEERWGHVLLTFLAGMGAAGMMLAYKYFWGEQFSFVFFSITPQDFSQQLQGGVGNVLLGSLLVFLCVGFLEEYMKHWITKTTDHGIFRSIDDVIEFSIIGALGFAFLENIGYLMTLFLQEESMGKITSLFFMRSIFVTFIHILCSGIYGYYYGLGYFAQPILNKRKEEGNAPSIPQVIHRAIHLKKVTVFRDEMNTFGLLIAMGIHGMYDFLLDAKTIGNLSAMMGGPTSFSGSGIEIHVFLLPTILCFGFWYLSALMHRPEDQKIWGKREIKEVFYQEKNTAILE